MANYKFSGFADEIDKSVDVQFEVLNKLNINYFEPRGIDGKNISTLTDEEVSTLKAKMDKAGIKVSSIGSPIGKMKIEDSFEEHFALFQRVCEIAKALDTKYIRMFSFYHEGGDNWTTDEREEVLKRLRQMIEYATSQDIILLHENEKGIYGDTADRCADLMKELYCENFKYVFDPANFVQCAQDTKYAYEILKDYIAYMHIKDALFENGRVVPAGLGDGNVEYILKQVIESGYEGFFSLEPHLGSFEGLADLELDDAMEGLPKSGEGTFTIAYRSLCNILDRIAK